MGMYDNITVKYPLPLPEYQARVFQTKDTPTQFLDSYEIDETGQLRVEEYEVEDRSDPNETGIKRIIGMITRINRRWTNSNFTGEINFYDSLSFDPENRGWIEFTATFVEGKLKKIELVKEEKLKEIL